MLALNLSSQFLLIKPSLQHKTVSEVIPHMHQYHTGSDRSSMVKGTKQGDVLYLLLTGARRATGRNTQEKTLFSNLLEDILLLFTYKTSRK